MMPAHDLTPTAVMPAHDLTPTAVMPAHDLTPTAVMPAHDPVPAATLAGNTAMGAALRRLRGGATRLMPAPPFWTACGPGTTPGWTQPATSISTTPAGACTPRASWPATGTCWPARCSATRTPRTCRRGEWAPGWRRPGRRSWSSSGPHRRSTRSSSPRTRPARCGWSASPFPFGPGGRYLLTFDNHNSVNGIRQFARAKGASVSYVPLPPPACASQRRRWPAI